MCCGALLAYPRCCPGSNRMGGCSASFENWSAWWVCRRASSSPTGGAFAACPGARPSIVPTASRISPWTRFSSCSRENKFRPDNARGWSFATNFQDSFSNHSSFHEQLLRGGRHGRPRFSAISAFAFLRAFSCTPGCFLVQMVHLLSGTRLQNSMPVMNTAYTSSKTPYKLAIRKTTTTMFDVHKT